MRPSTAPSKRALAFAVAALLSASAVIVSAAIAQADPSRANPTGIKHVWLIVLENKSYDATFTGLNDNTYLWKTLPQQGVLLKNYFGTGHFSLDNYTSMVSGQGPNPDGQDDCPQYPPHRADRSAGSPLRPALRRQTRCSTPPMPRPAAETPEAC